MLEVKTQTSSTESVLHPGVVGFTETFQGCEMYMQAFC